MLDLLKTATAVFFNLNVGVRLCKYFFTFSNGVVLLPSRAAPCERAPARIRWCTEKRCKEAHMAIKAIAMDIDGTLTE